MTEAGDVSIRQAANLSGVSTASLRAWEARYGFPRPRRLPGGHRRYPPEEIELIRRVARYHAEGLNVPAAVARVLEGASRPASMFAAVREVLPDATPQLLPKPALIAISHALEDECAWRAESPILVGGFQHRRFYEVERARWSDFAATAAGVFVVAEDLAAEDGAAEDRAAEDRGAEDRAAEEPDSAGRGPVLLRIESGDLARREWFVLCRSAVFSAVMVGWERPGRPRRPRRFEVAWTLEPAAAAAVLETVVTLAERRAPAVADRLGELHRRMPLPPPPDAATAMAVSRRIVEYLAARM